MLKRTLFALTMLLMLLLACSLGRPAPQPDAGPSQVPTPASEDTTTTENQFTASPTRPVPTATTTPLPPPATFTPEPEQVDIALTEPPMSEIFPDGTYVEIGRKTLDAYVIQLWQNESDDVTQRNNIVTIVSAGQEPVQIEMVSGFGVPDAYGTGLEWKRYGDVFPEDVGRTDVTGDGNPDLVLETYSGGAHCCFSTLVYELGAQLIRSLETRAGNCEAHFQDLDGDGVLEVVTCDDTFAYTYCSFAESPLVKVIYQYQPGKGYIPASPRFADLYADDIARDTQRAEQGMDDPDLAEDSRKCLALAVVLDYLYIGQSDAAWSELYRLYPYPDVETFRLEIEQAVNQSILFTWE